MSLLAVGILIGPRAPCVLRSGSEELGVATVPSLAYRCVVANTTPTARWRAAQDALLVAPCADAPRPYVAKQRSCTCKLVHWFRTAHVLYPHARFIGKIEDDTIVHWPALMAVLDAHKDLSMLWFGHFQWAVHDVASGRGRYCGGGDMHLRHTAPSRCVVGAQTDVLAPFATGAFDIRTRDLAAASMRVRLPSIGSCDGGQGYRMAIALAVNTTRIAATLLHLKQHHYRRTPRASTVVAHPHKQYDRRLTWNVTDNLENATVRMIARVATNRYGQTVLTWQKKEDARDEIRTREAHANAT